MEEEAKGGRAARRYLPEEGVSVGIWKQGKPCVLIAGNPKPMPLDAEELALLKRCDGKTEIEPSALSDRLEAVHIIRRCGEDGGSARPLRIVEYPNYFVDLIDWTITDRCNCNCRHCFHATDNSVQRNEFSLEDALRFLDEVKACGIPSVRLTGGEATLYPGFRELVQGMRERGLVLSSLLTNGSLLTPELLAFIKELHPNASVTLSFDGLGWHDWMRQAPGSEEKALQAVRLVKAAGLELRINANVHRRNASVMFDTLRLLADLGVDHFRVIRTSESPRWELNKENNTLTPEEYYDFSLDFAARYRESGISVPTVIWQSLFLNGRRKTFRILPIKAPACRFSENTRICGSMMKKPSVQANGDVVPCSPMGGYLALHGVHLGNVYETSLQELLTEGPFIDLITAAVGKKLRENPKCAACEFVRECQGGCPALGLICGGSIFSSDEHKCAFFRGGYPEKYRRVMNGWTEFT